MARDVPLAMMLFTLTYIIAYYGTLPDSIPRHFGADGMPDAWSDRGIIIVLPVLSFLMFFQSLLINWFLIISPEDPAKVINFSTERKEKLGFERLGSIRALTAHIIWFTNTLTTILFAYIVQATVKIPLGYQQGLGWGLWLILGVMFASIVFIGIKIYRLSRIPGA